MQQDTTEELAATDLPALTIMSLAQEIAVDGLPVATIADCAAASHGGPVRIHNEDHCLTLMSSATPNLPRRYLLAVADGVGGHNAGEVASETAIETLRACFEDGGHSEPHKWVTRAIHKANLAVFDHAHSDASYRSMQTTLTAVLIQGDRVAIGHVGDSRAYRFRQGSVHQLTQDHTHFLDLLRVRLVTADQAMHHPAVHQLTRSLGSEPIVRVDVVRDRIEQGDTYVVCSDGLWGSLSRGNLQRVIGDLPAEEACRRLIDLGVTLDADDNMSVGVAHIRHVVPELIGPSFLRRLRARIPGQ